MRDRLIRLICENIQTDECVCHCNHPYCFNCESLADHLIANNVFVLPEKMKDSWELTSAFVLRLFCANEEEVTKMKQEFEYQKIKQILTDIRDYLVERKAKCGNEKYEIHQIMGLGVEVFVDKAIADLTKYAEKLGVEL